MFALPPAGVGVVSNPYHDLRHRPMISFVSFRLLCKEGKLTAGTPERKALSYSENGGYPRTDLPAMRTWLPFLHLSGNSKRGKKKKVNRIGIFPFRKRKRLAGTRSAAVCCDWLRQAMKRPLETGRRSLALNREESYSFQSNVRLETFPLTRAIPLPAAAQAASVSPAADNVVLFRRNCNFSK